MNYSILTTIIVLISIELLLLNNSKKIGSLISLIDIPDGIRKFHKTPVPLVGGLILCVVIFLNSISFIFLNINYLKFEIILFLVFLTIFGLIDDKYNLNANFKFLFLIIFFTIFFLINNELAVSKLRFSSFRFELNFYEYIIIPFTVLSSLLLINSINMIDGKNGLCASIQIIILIFLTFYIFKHQYHVNGVLNFYEDELVFIYLYFLYLCFFLIFNIKGKVFLGDSGAYLGSFIIIYLILNIYSKNLFLNCEQIFFLLMVPGIDMLRVFLIRILNKKNPFKADAEHLHHLIGRKITSHLKITMVISLALLIPNLLINIFPKFTLVILFFSLSIYILSIKKLYNYEIKKI